MSDPSLIEDTRHTFRTFEPTTICACVNCREDNAVESEPTLLPYDNSFNL